MQEVIQGDTITLDVRFYDKEPAAGGVPVDPDNYLHTWEIQNDVNNRVSSITFLEGGVWPVSGTKYYFSIIDSGSDFEVKGYDDAGRTNEVVSTGALSYGVYAEQALNEVGGSGYAGTISITFPGIGGGVEDFEIEDIGATEPTYEIKDEDNATVVASVMFPTRVTVGHYQTVYAVAVTATPGENWRLIARATINKIDSFTEIPFRVVDAAVAEEEAGRLITLSELKHGIEKETDEDDEFLESLISPASELVEDYCGQLFHLESRIRIFDGNDQLRIHFDGEGPINSINKLEYSSSSGQLWTEIKLDKVNFDNFFLTRLDSLAFYGGKSNWKITYIAGRDKAPAQVRRGVIELIRFWYNTKDRGGVKADVVGGGLRIIYNDPKAELPPNVIQILKPWRRLF